MNYLELYEKWATTGYIEDNPNRAARGGNGGLCNTVIGKGVSLFHPETIEDIPEDDIWWGSDKKYTPNPLEKDKECMYGFSDLRKNIVLFLAAMDEQIK